MPEAEDAAPLKLVLVDDDESLRRVTGLQLRKAGYEVSEARDGVDALERIRETEPDILVSDIMMPRKNGLDLCAELRADPACGDLYIILLTAKDQTQSIVEGLQAKADDYVTKPFSVPEFLARVGAGARLRRLQNSLREKNEELQRALATQNRLWGLAAHDLRAPLSIITTYVTLLGQDMVAPEVIKDVCLRRSRGLMQLIDDVLDLSKIESGTIDTTPREENLSALMRDAMELFAPVAEERGVRLVEELPDRLPCRCDARRTATVLENLLDNAIKYTPGGGSVTVRGRREGDDARMEIADTGCGIHPENLERVFEPFAKIESPAAAPPDHSGLGLAICRKLLALQGGTIVAESEGAGRGATLRLTLPAAGQPVSAP